MNATEAKSMVSEVREWATFKLIVPIDLLRAMRKSDCTTSKAIVRTSPSDLEDVQYRMKQWARSSRSMSGGETIPSLRKLADRWDGKPAAQVKVTIPAGTFRASKAMAEKLGVDLAMVFIASMAYAVEVSKA